MTLGLSQEDKKKLLTKHEFARLCRTTPRTLRFYEQKGLFLPDETDQFTKYRYYDPRRMREFFQIKLLQDFSIPLTDIKTIRSEKVSKDMLAKKMQEIKKVIDEKEKEYIFLQHIRHFLFADEDTSALFKEETIGPFVLLSKKTKQGRYDTVGEEMRAMIAMAEKHHIPLEGTQMTFYEHLYQPMHASLELALVVQAKEIPSVSLADEYTFRMLPKTKIRYYLYKGPYAYITLIYQKVQESKMTGIAKNGRSIDIYLPVTKGISEYEQQTKIAFPQE